MPSTSTLLHPEHTCIAFIVLNPHKQTHPQFLFISDRGHINQTEVERVKDMIAVLVSRQCLLSDVVLPSEDTLCTICYSQSMSATFYPCKHQSCCACIIQHLMNSKQCFYCKSVIITVVNFDDHIIYEEIEPYETAI